MGITEFEELELSELSDIPDPALAVKKIITDKRKSDTLSSASNREQSFLLSYSMIYCVSFSASSPKAAPSTDKTRKKAVVMHQNKKVRLLEAGESFQSLRYFFVYLCDH